MKEQSVPISINVVVEGQLFVLLDIPFREDTHADIVADGPFCHITIWITAVVGETTDSTTFGCVDELNRPNTSRCARAPNRAVTHLVLLKHHEIKVLNALQRVIPHSLLERRWVDYIPYVLIYEGIPKHSSKPRTVNQRME